MRVDAFVGIDSDIGAPREIGDPRSRAACASNEQDRFFEADPAVVAPGELAILRWTVRGVSLVSLQEAGDAAVGTEREDCGYWAVSMGSSAFEIRPRQTMIYVLSYDDQVGRRRISALVRALISDRRVTTPRERSGPGDPVTAGDWNK